MSADCLTIEPQRVHDVSFEFDMTDALATRAAREAFLAFGRKLFGFGMLAPAAFVTAIFLVAVRRHLRWWLLVLWGITPALYVLLVAAWIALLWWAPRHARRKLSHLPHRRVRVDLSEQRLAIQTATEQVAVDWTMLKELRELPNFWVVCLKSDAEIPFPRDAVPADALVLLQSKAPAAATR